MRTHGGSNQNTEPFLPRSFRSSRRPAHVPLEQILLLAKARLLVYPLQAPGVATRATAAGFKAAPTVRSPAKIFGPVKPLLSGFGDRQPVRQTLVVPQRQCLRLVVYVPVQWPLPPTRGTMACPTIVAHITKTDTCSRCGRILVFYSPECVEDEFVFFRRMRGSEAQPIRWTSPPRGRGGVRGEGHVLRVRLERPSGRPRRRRGEQQQRPGSLPCRHCGSKARR